MINYYEELKKYLEAKNYKERLAHLETIKNRQVDVIKMYNQYKSEMKKPFLGEQGNVLKEQLKHYNLNINEKIFAIILQAVKQMGEDTPIFLASGHQKIFDFEIKTAKNVSKKKGNITSPMMVSNHASMVENPIVIPEGNFDVYDVPDTGWIKSMEKENDPTVNYGAKPIELKDASNRKLGEYRRAMFDLPYMWLVKQPLLKYTNRKPLKTYGELYDYLVANKNKFLDIVDKKEIIPISELQIPGKTFTIKSEDKAAFINRLDKMGIPVDTYKIHDNVLDDSFSIEFTNPESIKMIVQMLKKSPKIDVIKEKLNKVFKNVYTDKAVVVKEAELDFNPDELEWEKEDQCEVEVEEVLPITQYSYLTARVKTPDCDIVDIEFDDYEINNEIDHGMTDDGEEIWYGYIVGYYDRYVFYIPAAFTGSEEDGFEMIFDGDYDMIRAEIEDEGNYN
jgi:hypothetical protein